MIEQLAHTAPEDQIDRLGYKNPKVSVDDRVADFLGRMTLEEKVAQMLCLWGQKKTMLPNEDGKLSKLFFDNPRQKSISDFSNLTT
jgi:beta-glucosidase